MDPCAAQAFNAAHSASSAWCGHRAANGTPRRFGTDLAYRSVLRTLVASGFTALAHSHAGIGGVRAGAARHLRGAARWRVEAGVGRVALLGTREAGGVRISTRCECTTAGR